MAENYSRLTDGSSIPIIPNLKQKIPILFKEQIYNLKTWVGFEPWRSKTNKLKNWKTAAKSEDLRL